ncbi:hypothetical protein AB8O64_36895 (plasmid) [Streptomyces sp. QH1-20]
MSFQHAAGYFVTVASFVGALAIPFVIVAARRTVARIHAQTDQKEQ